MLEVDVSFLIILILIAFIFGLVTGVTLGRPRF